VTCYKISGLLLLQVYTCPVLFFGKCCIVKKKKMEATNAGLFQNSVYCQVNYTAPRLLQSHRAV
jgi:hypothetical protein